MQMPITKEECMMCLNQLIEDTNYYVGDVIYNDHKDEFDILSQLIQEHFNSHPYKYAELKKGMLVWDDSIKTTVKISTTFKNKGRRIVRIKYEEKYFSIEFEEGRFFPLTKANQ